MFSELYAAAQSNERKARLPAGLSTDNNLRPVGSSIGTQRLSADAKADLAVVPYSPHRRLCDVIIDGPDNLHRVRPFIDRGRCRCRSRRFEPKVCWAAEGSLGVAVFFRLVSPSNALR